MKKETISQSRGRAPFRRSPAVRAAFAQPEDYFTFGWLLLFATYLVMSLIFFLFTPYTHQLDEIKNLLLMSLPPFLFAAAVYGVNFNRMSWRTHASTYLFGGFVLVMLVSYLLNPHKPVAERVVWFQLACGTFTVTLAWFMDSEAKLRKTMVFFVLTAFASVLIGLFLFAGRGFTDIIYNMMEGSRAWSPQARNLVLTLASSKEMYSTILNSDFFAAYLVMTIPLSLSMFFVEDRVRFKAIAVATFLLMNVCLVFTNSNDSFMSMILITYPVYFLLGFTHLKELNLSRRVLVTFFSGSAMLLATGLLLMLPKLQQTWDFKAAALEGRKVLWLGGFWPWLYRNDPSMQNLDIVSILFGTGPGGYRFYFPVFRRADFFDNQINNVTTFGHNYYIDILCEFGIAGLLLFLVFYGRVLYDGVRQVLRTGNHAHRFYQTACVAGLSGIALQNFFSPNNRWAVCGMVFYAMFGLSMGLHQIDNPGEERPTDATSPRPGPFVAKIFLGLLAGLFLFRSVPQGFSHFQGAMANGRGLTYMEIAERYEGAKQTQWLQMARDSFEEAIRLNPTFATSYYKVAHVYNQLGQIDKAIEKYEALERYNPNYSEIHLNLGIMYSVKSGDLSGAAQLKLIQKAYKEIKEGARQELKPNVQWIAGTIGHQLADLYEELGDNLKTDAGLTEGAASPNKDGNELALELRNEIKQYYRNIVTYKPQLEEFRMERKKYYVRAQVKLVELAYLTDNLGEAEDVLKQMYTDEPDKPEYLAQLVSFFDKQGKRKEKVEFLDNAVHNAPTDTRLRRALATGYKELGETAKYLTELRRIEVLNPKDRSALTNLYLNYQSAGDAAKAAEYRTKLQAAGFNTDKLTTLTADDDSTTGDIDTIPDAEQALLKNEEGTSKASAVAAPSNPRTAQALATTESDASPTTEPAGTVPAAPATTAVEGITSK